MSKRPEIEAYYEVALNGGEGQLHHFVNKSIRSGTVGVGTGTSEFTWNAGLTAAELEGLGNPALALFETDRQHKTRRLVVALMPNGAVKFGAGVKLDQASIAFYRVVGTMLRLMQ